MKKITLYRKQRESRVYQQMCTVIVISLQTNILAFFLQVVGLPTPDICWYLDGKLIRPDDYHKMLVCEKSVHSFIIEIVTIHHAGVYECVAKNRAGESHFSLHLDVMGEQSPG